MYNLTRFAREKYDHFALRAHLKSLGISLRSATEPIDDTSTGKLMEGFWRRSRSSTTTYALTAREPVCAPHLNSADGPFLRPSDI